MSVHAANNDTSGRPRPVMVHHVRAAREAGEKLTMLTAYDYLSAQILDEAGVPMILVGDSLGMVMLGYDSTVPVTVEEMLHHTRAVSRGAPNSLVIADLPFGSYQQGPEQALATATRFLKEAGANAVKLEGGGRVVDAVAHLVGAGIPVVGHLGLTPQSVNALGGYRVQGRGDEAAEQMLADARALAGAGAFCIVIEAVPRELGRRVTAAVEVPTIGIGAGPDTDGQVLVWHDLLGLNAGRQPRFVKRYADLRGEAMGAVTSFMREVSAGEYPADEHCY